jgi:hypothetical protein
MKTYESPADALNDLKKRGYEADFEPQSDCLYCNNLDLRLYEEEFHVDEVYRFEGNSNPGNNAVIYALSSPTGLKGTIVNSDEAPSNNTSCEIQKKLQNHQAVGVINN